ncbi:MAG: hypothetical protein HY874_00055 [Chloroflexi bacterium]|nr:hypothetical protein [Chloroflexota bacterium]
MDPIILSMRRYRGARTPGLRGQRVVVIAVHRGGEEGAILKTDAEVGELRPSDRLEFVQLVRRADGTEYTTWATADARPDELGLAEGVWTEPVETTVLFERTTRIERRHSRG